MARAKPIPSAAQIGFGFVPAVEAPVCPVEASAVTVDPEAWDEEFDPFAAVREPVPREKKEKVSPKRVELEYGAYGIKVYADVPMSEYFIVKLAFFQPGAKNIDQLVGVEPVRRAVAAYMEAREHRNLPLMDLRVPEPVRWGKHCRKQWWPKRDKFWVLDVTNDPCAKVFLGAWAAEALKTSQFKAARLVQLYVDGQSSWQEVAESLPPL